MSFGFVGLLFFLLIFEEPPLELVEKNVSEKPGSLNMLEPYALDVVYKRLVPVEQGVP